MIPNVVRGTDFRGCLDYLFQKEKLPLIVATNMVGQSPSELAIEFEMIRQLNQRSTVPVWHVSLAARPDEVISLGQWAEVVDRFVRKVGEQAGTDEKSISPEGNQFVAVAHGDRDHPHVHLVLNRVLDSGEVCYCKWDHNRAQQACREVEQELGLVTVTTQETAAEVEVEPKFRLPREIIAQLELQADRSGTIDPRLQQYYDHRRQRLEEIFDGNGTGVSHSTQDDQPTDSAANRAEAASLSLVAATERTHAAVTHLLEQLQPIAQLPQQIQALDQRLQHLESPQPLSDRLNQIEAQVSQMDHRLKSLEQTTQSMNLTLKALPNSLTAVLQTFLTQLNDTLNDEH